MSIWSSLARAVPRVSAVLCTGLLFVAAAQADVRRCEDDKGRITYSNEACPTGTAKERPVENRPAVEVPRDGTGGKATHEGVAVKRAEVEHERLPEKSQDVAREQNRAQVARCDDLVRRIEYSQQDLLTASAAEKASVELGVRRLQDEYQANCARH
jgi:hypothetical protein